MIEHVLRKAGGRAYLLRIAENDPKLFVRLVEKLMPTETNLRVQGSYVALPVPVEMRDVRPAEAIAVIEAEYKLIEPPTPVDDDWLD